MAKTVAFSAAKKPRAANLAEGIYQQLKTDIFNFHRLPGERFTEQEIAEQSAASRTPVREALYRLQREGYVQVYFRSGWQVKPFDFRYFEELYDVRTVLECAAVKRLCELETVPEALHQLQAVWWLPVTERLQDGQAVSVLDEQFHQQLVAATQNQQMAIMHRDVTEKIRIIRRLDFTKTNRITATYDEHAEILHQIIKRQADQAQLLLKTHIAASKAEVRKITLHMLHEARDANPSAQLFP